MRHFFGVIVLGLLLPLAAAAAPRVIHVASGDVDGLYAAVYDPDNDRATIVLEPGTYVLTPEGRPRGGSLLLQEGSTLVGENVYRDEDQDGVWDADFDGNPVISGETIIDGRAVIPIAEGEGSAVIHYRDGVRISGITVLTPPDAVGIGVPEPELIPASGVSVRVEDTFIDGANAAVVGIAIGNGWPDSRMFIERNIIRGNAYGVAAVNFSPDEPVRLRVVLHDNHIIANHLGLHTRNTAGTDRGQYQLESAGNLFEGNWAAVEATSGTDLGTPDGAHDNRYELTSIGDTFRRNFLVSLLIVGAWRVNDGASAESNNLMELTVLDGTFDDAEAVHAWPVVFWPAAGDTGNRIKLLIRGARHSPGMNPQFRILDPLPDDSNSAVVVGGDTAFSASNGAALEHDGFMPPHPFDMSGSALHFTPTGNGYAVTAGSAALDLDVGDPVPLMGCDLDDPPCYPVDDDTGEIPFSFSFEGQAYPSLWVNSDGNITFGEGDRASDNRDVKRLVTGPPRIAAFLEDLALDQGGELLYKVHPDRLVITWYKIPTWRLNLEDENTIQVILHADTSASCPRCFDIVYGVVKSEDAVVGFSQGGWAEGLATDLSEAAGVAGTTVYEAFFTFSL